MPTPNRAKRRKMNSDNRIAAKSLGNSTLSILDAVAKEILTDTDDVIFLSNEDARNFEDARKAFARHYSNVARNTKIRFVR